MAIILGIGAIAGERDRRGEDARIEANAALALVERDIARTSTHLSTVRSYLEGSNDVTPSEFARFEEGSTPTGRTPWRAVAVAVGTFEPESEPWDRYRETLSAEHDAEGYPDFVRFPEASDSELRTAVVLVEPGTTREQIFGFDMASEPVREAAIRRALESGQIEITEAVTLTQDVQGQPSSILMLTALRSDALASAGEFAVVAISLTPSALLGAALTELDLGGVRYEASLLNPSGDTLVAFSSAARRTEGFAPPSLRTVGPFELGVDLGPDRLLVRWQSSTELAQAPLTAALLPAGAILLVTLLTVALVWRIEGEQTRLEQVLASRERDLRASEEAIAHSQRREALGRLTGGVAHDFNNLLSVVIGSLELMSIRIQDDEEAEQLRQNALAASERGARLTQRLLTLGRQATLQPEVLDVSEVFSGTDALLRASVPENIDLVIQPSDDHAWVRADRTQLEAGLLNLVINARDAMPDGGILTVSKYHATLPLQTGQSPELPPGEYVVLSVRDTGVGMSPEILAAATDPFFTTKEQGAGTGLGLSTVLGFARQSGGDVVIESVEGRGTWVRVFLPEAQPEQSSAPDETGEADASDGTTHLLVVEDEEAVRRVIHRQLERLGFVVETAESGDQALSMLEGGMRPDLVLSDVMMPGLNDGSDVARVARRLDVPVILMSGYPRGLSDSGDPTEVRLLAKPFRIDDLVNAIREELSTST